VIVAQLLFLNHEDPRPRDPHVYQFARGTDLLRTSNLRYDADHLHPISTVASRDRLLRDRFADCRHEGQTLCTAPCYRAYAPAASAAPRVRLQISRLQAKQILRLKGLLTGIPRQTHRSTLEVIERDADRDFYLDAQQAVEYGLVDQVIETPEKVVK